MNARGLGWDAGEVTRAGFDPGLHPRGVHGKFAREPGGGRPPAAAPGAAAHAAGSTVQRFGAADSLTAHTLPDGTLNPQRAALHAKIISGALAGHRPAGGRPHATFLGGGTASGKSALLASSAPDTSVKIDADGVKEKLPEYRQRVAAGDTGAAAYAHEESSHVAKAIQAEAISRGLDFTLDGTGDNTYEKMRGKITAARRAGYAVHAKYVTADTEEAVRRARARAEKTGRMVPETTIREIHAAVSDTFAKLVAGGDLDAAELWDTNGPKPVLVGSKPEGGSWAVKDERAWQRFLDKAR